MFIRFVFGLIIGSFLNVLSMRYVEDKFLFANSVLGGRSHCPHCKKTLRWFELIPLFSFLIQRGRCRNCGKKIGLEYPFVELVSGLIFVFVPLVAKTLPASILWTSILEVLFLAALIDKRLYIIPDELSTLLAAAGVASIFISQNFAGPYAFFFGFEDPSWLNHLLGLFAAGLVIGLVVLVTRARGMGIGDIKLAAALGLAAGWPGGLMFIVFAFLSGALAGGAMILFRRKKMQSALPFAPFLFLGFLLLFFFGPQILGFYLQTLTGISAKLLG